MAASLTISLFFTATTLCCLLPSAAAAKPDFAIQVCKNTTDFAFCRAAVYSDSHTRGADQYELVDVIFRLAYPNATDTRDYIAAEIKSGGSGGLEKCLANYKTSIEILGNMLNDVNSETYDDLASQSMDVERSVRSCRGGEGLQLQGRWGQLAKRNQNMLKLANMCYVISKLFLVFI